VVESLEAQDAVSRFSAASENCDVAAMAATLAASAELISPVSGRMRFTGRSDLQVLLAAIYGVLSNVRWTRVVGQGNVRIVLGEATIARVHLTDAMVIELDGDGNIQRITPHIRPWLGLTLIALALVPRMFRQPGVIVRAFRSTKRQALD
jgi:hypothetical protein